MTLLLLGVALGVTTALVAGPSGRAVAAVPQPYVGQCPGGSGQCVVASLPCTGSETVCPTVVAGPTENLVTAQYVSLSFTNFPPNDIVRVAYCTADGSGTIVADPSCANDTVSGILLGRQSISVDAHGAGEATMPVDFDPSGSDDTGLSASALVYNGSPQSTFFCDNGPDFCDLNVTDDGNTNTDLETATNTVLLPLNFAPGALACPASDPTVFTDGAFSVEHLLPSVVQATCANPGGVVDLNTSTNDQAMLSDLTSGGTEVAFTNDATDPIMASALAPTTTTSYSYIPVALSATVVAFEGGVLDNNTRNVYPVNQYNMTPNMVAGSLTTAYNGGGTVDSLVTAPTGLGAPLDCQQIVGCNEFTAINYNPFYLLNPQPKSFVQPNTIGSFFSNTFAGTNYQLSDWMCNAPNTPFKVKVNLKGEGPTTLSVTDQYNTAASTLTTPPLQSPFWDPQTKPKLWPFKTCSATSTFPTLSPGSVDQYQPADTPSLQAKAIRAYSGDVLAVGDVDWSEASFNGLNSVSLQNAAGQFVTPSAASIDAAMADAVENPNGTYTYDYGDTADAAAYPMPSVTYAVVPNTPLPPAQATALSDLLTNVVNFSDGKDGALPGGYVALTPALYAQAMKDIPADVVAISSPTPPATTTPTTTATAPAKPKPVSTTTTTTASTPPTAATIPSDSGTGAPLPSSTDDSGFDNSAETDLGTSNFEPTSTAAATPPAATVRRAGRGSTTPSASAETLAGFDVTTTGSRLVLPLLAVLAILAVVGGLLLLAWPSRRRQATTAAADGDSAVDT